MSEEIVYTPEEKLVICNATSIGKSMKEAKAMVMKARGGNTEAAPETEKKKPSAKEKKEALAKEIEALGGEVPAENASVAKFEEALTAAKTAKEEADKDGDGKDLL